MAFVSFRPRSVECVTTQNTFCSPETEAKLAPLSDARFFTAGNTLRQTEASLKKDNPELASVAIRRTASGKIVATLEQAAPLLYLTLEGQTFLLRENGALSAAEQPEGQLLVELTATISGQQLAQPWGRNEEKKLAQLLDSLEHFRPRIKKISAKNPQEIVAFPENNGPIVLRVDESANIAAQLSTLQAFFRSTTIETPYREIDARFAHLVVKE